MYLGKFNLNSIDETKEVARNLYKLSKAGDMFALYGDIGTGKTTFARYFINQAIKKCKVPSPSYNIYFRYECPKAPIYHVDAWRIENSNEIFNLGVVDYFKESIFLIEWADKIETHLPKCKLCIKIEYNKNFRTIKFHGDKNWEKRLTENLNREFIEQQAK